MQVITPVLTPAARQRRGLGEPQWRNSKLKVVGNSHRKTRLFGSAQQCESTLLLGKEGANLIKTRLKGIDLIFETSPALFAPKGIDLGTLSLLSDLDFGKGDKVLDLGCGYGVVGIFAAKLVGEENVVMVDIKQAAVELSKRNAALNGVSGIKLIQSDGFANLDEKGFNRLSIGGKMYLVTKRKKW
ncbi:MAG: methyltransferase [Firmicutes bacterium]|nr:methyltransferase [Bacillota bacterium]